jgi:hypothetical protein
MTRETARIIVEQLDNYLSHTCQDYGERDHEAMMMAIKALEQENVLFKSGLLKDCETCRAERQSCYNPDEWCHDCKEYDQDKHCCPRFNNVIRKTVEEIKRAKVGHWIVEKGNYLGMRNGHCSCCNDYYTNDWNEMKYCPNCGADMREVEE